MRTMKSFEGIMGSRVNMKHKFHPMRSTYYERKMNGLGTPCLKLKLLKHFSMISSDFYAFRRRQRSHHQRNTNISTNFTGYICPRCGNIVLENYHLLYPVYCQQCGAVANFITNRISARSSR